MVEAYWGIGKQVAEAQGERAEYGKQLLKYLAEQLTAEFGAGFDESNLRKYATILFSVSNSRHTVFAFELVAFSLAYAY